jgi:hypothetical protein
MTRDLYKAVNQVQPSGQYWSVTIGDTMEVFISVNDITSL